MADLSSEAWRQAFAGDHAAGSARAPWSRDAASRPGRRGVSFDSYSSVEYRLVAVERDLSETQDGLRSVAGEVAGARDEMRDLGRRVRRLPGRGFLLFLLLVLLIAGTALAAFAPEIQQAASRLL